MPKTAPVSSKKRAASKRSVRSAAQPSGPRRLTVPKRIWYKPATWRHKPPVPVREPVPKARLIFGQAVTMLWRHWRLFGGILLIYTFLTLLLVHGFSTGDNLTSIKDSLDSLSESTGDLLINSFAAFAAMLSGSESGVTASGGVYQSILVIIGSLAFIWALRQVHAGKSVRIRDSFYQGMYPLVPFVLVFLLLSVQLVPLAVGSGVYSIVVNFNIAVHPWEKIMWATVLVALALWSLRMITASIFALYIVTLPNMTPLRAYRSAKQMVYGRRLLVWRKVIFLLLVLILLAALILVPLIFFLTPVATWVFFACSMLALPVFHSYMYNLYREML